MSFEADYRLALIPVLVLVASREGVANVHPGGGFAVGQLKPEFGNWALGMIPFALGKMDDVTVGWGGGVQQLLALPRSE